MNVNGILTQHTEFENYHIDEYKFLSEPVELILTLKCRAWGKSMGLICFFEDEEGNKIKAYAFRKNKDGKEMYTPTKSKIDFSQVKDETKWKCIFELNRNKRLSWVSAESMG